MKAESTMELTEALNQTVTSVLFDYAVSLAFDARNNLRIGCAFTIRVPNSQTDVVVTPGQPGTAANHIAALHGTLLTEATCTDEGTLRIAFSNGTIITVPPDPDFEAWDFRTSEGLLVCTPGGWKSR